MTSATAMTGAMVLAVSLTTALAETVSAVVANGRKLADYRAAITVAAIQKAISSPR